MTLAQKLTLAGVALVCIILIVAFSPDAPQQAGNRGGSQGAPLAVVDRNLSNAAAGGAESKAPAKDATSSVAPSSPAATAPSSAPAIAPGTPPTPPSGYDALLARIREVDEVRDAAAGTPGEGDVPPVTPAPPLTAPVPATPGDAPSADAPAVATPLAAAADAPASSTPASASDEVAPLAKPDAELPAAKAVPTLTVGPQPGAPTPAAADARTNRDEPDKPSDDILKQVADLPLADDLPASPEDAQAGPPKGDLAAPAKAEQPDSPVAPAAANAIVNKPATAAANTTTDADAPVPAKSPAAAPAASTAPPVPADPITRTAAGRSYTVQPGDTFSSIAKAVYGAEKHWIELAEANRQIDPKKLKAGMMVKLPELPSDSPKAASSSPAKSPEAAPPAKAAEAKPAFTPTTHEVKAGENLSAISKQHYNTADHWRHIYLTNREAIGGDPGKLKAGTKLKITAPVKD